MAPWRRFNRSAKPDVFHPAQKVAKRDSTRVPTCMCHEMCHGLFHPTSPYIKCSAPCHLARSTKQTARVRSRAPSRTSSADATGQTSSKKASAPWSKARDADRKRQERAPSPPSSADATGQALSKKERYLARIRPFVHSFAASITAPAPAQQLKCQPLAFDDSSREAATASGLAIVKVFFEDRNMEHSCAFAQDSLGSTLFLLRRSHRPTAPTGFIRPRPPGIPLAPGGVVIEVRGRTIRSQALNFQSIKVFLLLSLSLPCPTFLSRVA